MRRANSLGNSDLFSRSVSPASKVFEVDKVEDGFTLPKALSLKSLLSATFQEAR